MSELPVQSIGDLCERGLAQIQTGPFGTQLHSHEYIEDGVPVVPTEAIRNRRIDLSVCPRISPEKASELRRHALEEGDILFARRGVQATGHIGVIRAKEAGYICGTGAIRLRVEESNNIVSAEYLSHLLADEASIAWFKFHAIGATMPNLNEGIIKSFPLILPNIDEQKAIADIRQIYPMKPLSLCWSRRKHFSAKGHSARSCRPKAAALKNRPLLFSALSLIC